MSADFPSVRKEVVVSASRERAFRVFTEQIDLWWPRSHHIGKSPMKQFILEPRAQGRWYAVNVDGTECDTGKVLIWDPPHRVVLAWQITGKWEYDPNFVTEVDVRFFPEAADRTRVELEHRDIERFGLMAQNIRDSISSPGGWSGILQAFATVANAP